MKFQWIGTGPTLARIAIFTMLLLGSAPAFAVDEDIPPPADVDIPAPKSSVGSKKTANDSVLNEDESIPAPSLGDEALPEPSVDRGQERAKNQVNKAPEEDEIFLPTPNVNDNVYYAPVGTPAPRLTAEDVDWRSLGTNRPMFSLYGGVDFKAYPNDFVETSRTMGYMLGLSIRMFSIAQTVFLHTYFDYIFHKTGNVGSVRNVLDHTQHLGGMLEIGLGRRLSLFGTMFLRKASAIYKDPNQDEYELWARYNKKDARNIGEDPTWYPGLSLQYDFHVIPHGSLGIIAHVERDIYSLALAVAMEPAPPKKFNLNYEEMNR